MPYIRNPLGYANSFMFHSSVMSVEGPKPFANNCSHSFHLSINFDNSYVLDPRGDYTQKRPLTVKAMTSLIPFFANFPFHWIRDVNLAGSTMENSIASTSNIDRLVISPSKEAQSHSMSSALDVNASSISSNSPIPHSSMASEQLFHTPSANYSTISSMIFALSSSNFHAARVYLYLRISSFPSFGILGGGIALDLWKRNIDCRFASDRV